MHKGTQLLAFNKTDSSPYQVILNPCWIIPQPDNISRFFATTNATRKNTKAWEAYDRFIRGDALSPKTEKRMNKGLVNWITSYSLGIILYWFYMESAATNIFTQIDIIQNNDTFESRWGLRTKLEIGEGKNPMLFEKSIEIQILPWSFHVHNCCK